MRYKIQKYKAYFLLSVISLFFLYTFALSNIYNVLSKYFMASFDLTPLQVGFISSLSFYGNILLLVPAGIICDRLQIKGIIFYLVLLSASLTLITAFVTNAIELGILKFFTGILGAFGFVACMKVATNLLEQRDLSKAAGIIAVMGMLGGLMVQTPLAYLVQNTSWKVGLITMGVIGYIISIIIFFALREISFPLYHQQGRNEVLSADLKKTFLNSQNLLYASYLSLMNFPIYMLGAMWGIPYLMKTGGFTETQAATISGMLFIGMIIGAPIIGILANSVEKARKVAFLGALSAIIIVLTISSNATNYYFMLCLFFLLGVISSTQLLSYFLVVNNNPIYLSATATSVVSIVSLLGGAVAQPLFGGLLSYFSVNNVVTAHSYSIAIYILLIAFIGALMISLFFKKKTI